MRSRVELFEVIRRDARVEGLSIRGLADRHGVHRRTVRQALEAAEPPARKVPQRPAPRLDPAKASIDAMMREDLVAPKKQRHTARRVHARLVDEHAFTEITYSTVRDYVRDRRPQIWAEAGRSPDVVFVVQFHEPGAHAEVDQESHVVGWDPYFTDYMTFLDIYHYGTQHYEHHRRQLTLAAVRGQ